jgi:hypothetical protein
VQPLIEAEDYHSEESIAKMRQGVALTDNDRWAWLAVVRSAATAAEVDEATPTGPAVDNHVERFQHVAQPALVLWVAR